MNKNEFKLWKENPAPAFIESLLLQSFLKEKGKLPSENQTFYQ